MREFRDGRWPRCRCALHLAFCTFPSRTVASDMTPPALDPALDYEPQPTRGRTKSSAAYTPREAADSALHSPAPAPPPVSRAGPRSSPERWSNPEEELEVYREMLEDRSVALVQLAPHIWVAEVYNVTQDRRMV